MLAGPWGHNIDELGQDGEVHDEGHGVQHDAQGHDAQGHGVEHDGGHMGPGRKGPDGVAYRDGQQMRGQMAPVGQSPENLTKKFFFDFSYVHLKKSEK